RIGLGPCFDAESSKVSPQCCDAPSVARTHEDALIRREATCSYTKTDQASVSNRKPHQARAAIRARLGILRVDQASPSHTSIALVASESVCVARDRWL